MILVNKANITIKIIIITIKIKIIKKLIWEMKIYSMYLLKIVYNLVDKVDKENTVKILNK